jgi:hypothetical protein
MNLGTGSLINNFMIIKYNNTSSFSLEADTNDGRDTLFLKEFITSIPKKDRELFLHFLQIETNNGDDEDIVKITFCPYGIWCDEELKKIIKKRLKAIE